VEHAGRLVDRGALPSRHHASRIIVALAAGVVGALIGLGGTVQLAVAGVVGGFCILVVLPSGTLSRVSRARMLSVELPIALLLFGTLTWRVRDAATLATNPFDLAGIIQLASVTLGGLLGAIALLATRGPQITTRRWPIIFYVAYVFVVFLGAPLSVIPLLTVYRGVQLAAMLLAVAGAYHAGGSDAAKRATRVIYWFSALYVLSALANMVVFPGQAISHIASPIPLRLRGIVPLEASDSIGFAAAILGLWTLVRLWSTDPDDDPIKPGVGWILVWVSLVALLLSQSRSAYVSVALGLGLLFLYRGRKWLAAGIVLAAALFAEAGSAIVQAALPFLLRGQGIHAAFKLQGRINFWKAAIPVWQTSPWLGRGLLTATRFEIAPILGRPSLPTLHSTWFEALAGTGVVGVTVLALSFISAWRRALVLARRGRGQIGPAVVMAALTARCLTWSAFERFEYDGILFLVIVCAMYAKNVPVLAGGRRGAGSTDIRTPLVKPPTMGDPFARESIGPQGAPV
jgi:hypothetical protein